MDEPQRARDEQEGLDVPFLAYRGGGAARAPGARLSSRSRTGTAEKPVADRELRARAEGRAGSAATTETRCMSFDVEVSLVDRSGTAYALTRAPRSIPSLGGLTAIDAGSLATCGIDAAGLVQCPVLYALPQRRHRETDQTVALE